MALALIAYDGSQSARAAVHAGAELLSGIRSVVVTVHDHPLSLERAAAAARVALPDSMIRRGVAALVREIVDAAHATAEEGVALATELGLAAEVDAVGAPGAPSASPRACSRATARSSSTPGHRPVGHSLPPTRGRGGVASTLLGSVSAGLVHNAELPTLIVKREDQAKGP